MHRLHQMEKRYLRYPDLRIQCNQFFEEYIRLHHMSEVTEDKIDPEFSYFMPYHPVFKPDSTTTKLRIVFDASCHQSSEASLNEILMIGPVVQDQLHNVIMRFRMHRFVFTADVEKMFRQIEMKPEHRKLQLIVHRPTPTELVKIYEMNTVTYGTASAPYTSTRVLKHLAETEADKFPLASATLLNDCYMDDLATGCDDFQQALNLRQQATDLLQCGRFKLRKWSTNSVDLLLHIPPEDCEAAQTHHFDKADVVKTLGFVKIPSKIKSMQLNGFSDASE